MRPKVEMIGKLRGSIWAVFSAGWRGFLLRTG